MDTYERLRHRPQWLTLHKRNLDPREGIPAAVKNHAPLEDWDKLRSPPTARLEDELRLASTIAAAEYDHALVATCLQRAFAIAVAGAEDDRWGSLWKSTQRINHAKFLSAATLVKAWLTDNELDQASLVSAAREIHTGALTDRPTWSELAQSEHIHGTQLLLMARDIEAACAKVVAPKSFDRVQRYFSWFSKFLNLVEADSDPHLIRTHFDSFFDVVRDPFIEVPTNDVHGNNLPGLALIRLRLALIRWIYIERQPVAGNWRHIIGQIGY
jgi:hypothetical protein